MPRSVCSVSGNAVTVIGIDPGSRVLGWGVVREASGVLHLVDCGVVRPDARAETAFSARLAYIYRELAAVIGRLVPDEAAVEQVFTAKNAACAAHGLDVSDYEPRLVKKSLVGAGGADKEQVSFMVGRLLNTRPDWALDTSDALAVAICHLTMRRFARLAR